MKIKVPEEMYEAGYEAQRLATPEEYGTRGATLIILEAALIWLDGELDRLREKHGRWEDAVRALRRMFREQPEVPEEIKDLLDRYCSETYRGDLREAYRRGQKNPKE